MGKLCKFYPFDKTPSCTGGEANESNLIPLASGPTLNSEPDSMCNLPDNSSTLSQDISTSDLRNLLQKNNNFTFFTFKYKKLTKEL